MICFQRGELLVPVGTNGAAEFPTQKSAPSMFWHVSLWEQTTILESLPFAAILLYEANKTEAFLSILMNKTTQKQLQRTWGVVTLGCFFVHISEQWKLKNNRVGNLNNKMHVLMNTNSGTFL